MSHGQDCFRTLGAAAKVHTRTCICEGRCGCWMPHTSACREKRETPGQATCARATPTRSSCAVERTDTFKVVTVYGRPEARKWVARKRDPRGNISAHAGLHSSPCFNYYEPQLPPSRAHQIWNRDDLSAPREVHSQLHAPLPSPQPCHPA